MAESHSIKVSRFKCPCCSMILKIKMVDNITSMKLVCPTCKESILFSQFIPLGDNANSRETTTEKTEYRSVYKRDRLEKDGLNYSDRENKDRHTTLGKIVLLGDYVEKNEIKKEFILNVGKNIIGRKSTSSTATIQIENESLRLSREHLVIDVKKTELSIYRYIATLYKENVNATFVNDEKLEYGDKILLKSGDVIKLPDVVIKLEI